MLRVDPAVGSWGVGFAVLSGRMRHRKQRRQVPLTGVREGWKESGNPERVDTARSQEIQHAAV
jgi:hypothetical protein